MRKNETGSNKNMHRNIKKENASHCNIEKKKESKERRVQHINEPATEAV